MSSQTILLRRSFAPILRHIRLKSKSTSKSSKSTKYVETLALPRTEVPLSNREGAAAKRELEIQKVCGFDKLYDWQASQSRENLFTLHDGPPYANGKPHVGHALNKILKDIVLRYKLLRGYRVHYVPGWDCHGLPIELKAMGEVKEKVAPMQIRERARKFAEKAIEAQRTSFKRWGVMADWEKPYLTFTKEYQACQLEVFYKMYEKRLIYQGVMPVHWSPSSRTALAEAELVYNDHHLSKSIYVKFPLKAWSSNLQDKVGSATQVFALIWTTTPWTLPFNKAICFAPDIQYSVVQLPNSGGTVICEQPFLPSLVHMLGSPATELGSFQGRELEAAQYKNPITGEVCPFLPGPHVLEGKGTGLVHTAPAHGAEDFQIAKKHGLSVECHVDMGGTYTEGAGPGLVGKTIGVDAETAVIEKLGDLVLHTENFVHSYPYDWRTKQPVILRASKQWFINTEKIKRRALECVGPVSIQPKASEQGMLKQLERRTYWCISRQRAWGVPIPVFYHRQSDEPLISRETVEHIKGLLATEGPDFWWTQPMSVLLPNSLLEAMGKGKSEDYVKGEDILDIWFDSGTSWAAVLQDMDYCADMYIEGLDQFGGWFQSSLLTSVAVNDKAPYRSLLVHGFTTDKDGRKMSKSLGNVVDPDVVTDGSKGEPAYGADVLRYWATCAHLQTNVAIGKDILEKANNAVFTIRKCLRFLLGNLYDFDAVTGMVPYDQMLILDKYMMTLLYKHGDEVTKQYDANNFNRVLQLTELFINTKVSNMYSTFIKDRCYCSKADSVERRSTQSAQYHILEVLLKSLAPLLPHLAEEMFQHMPRCHSKRKEPESSIFKTSWFTMDSDWLSPSLVNDFEVALNIRRDLNSVLNSENPVEFEAIIYGSDLLLQVLKRLQPDARSATSALNEVLGTSYTSLIDTPPNIMDEDSQTVDGACTVLVKGQVKMQEQYRLIVIPAMEHLCERCRRYTASQPTVPCQRCVQVVAQNWAE